MSFFNRVRSPLSSLLSRRITSTLPSISKPAHSPLPIAGSISQSLLSRRIISTLPSIPKPGHSPLQIARNFYRTYYTNSPKPYVYHFRRRTGPKWYHNQRNLVIAVVVTGGMTAVVYFGNLETVPYTKRTHLILLSPAMERQLGESQFEQMKEALKGKVLPPLHPDSVRVRLIASRIIQALQMGLRHDQPKWSDNSYSPYERSHHTTQASRDETVFLLHTQKKESPNTEDRWRNEDEVLDDKWVEQSRQTGGSRSSYTRHLDGLNWEVIVVKDKMVNAACLPGGKIVVFTGLLDHFQTDPEIATVLAHEVGHAIARHSAEMITRNLWFTALQLIILQFIFMPDLISTLSNLLLRLPFSRRMEMEADHIGIMLLAAAGYDPRIAPRVYEKLGKITGDSALNNYLSTHPSSKKRSQLLSEARVMDEALAVYRDSVSGNRTEGFL